MKKQTKQAMPAKQASNAKPKGKVKGSDEEDEFIGDDSISEGQSRYLKFEQGTTKFRCISKPITGWIEWIEDAEGNRKPVRTTIEDGEPEASDPKQPPKKFTTFVVIDRADESVKILELTQQSVIKAIRALANNPDWGSPFTYDINVGKKGEKLKTKYTVTPSPKTKLSKDLVAVAQETPCNLEALYAGEDPWADENETWTEYILK